MRPLLKNPVRYWEADKPTDRVEAVINRLSKHRMMRVGDVLDLVERMACDLNCTPWAVRQAYEKRADIRYSDRNEFFVKGRPLTWHLKEGEIQAEIDGRSFTRIGVCGECGRWSESTWIRCDACSMTRYLADKFRKAQEPISEKKAIGWLKMCGGEFDQEDVVLYQNKTRLRRINEAIQNIANHQERSYGNR